MHNPHAPHLRRVLVAAASGVVASSIVAPFIAWEPAVLAGWDVAAVAFLSSAWRLILGADAAETRRLALREDETRETATALLLGASLASLLAVGFLLHVAGDAQGGERVALVAAGVLTVLLSWAVTNTVFTLRYADLHYRGPAGGVDFTPAESPASFADTPSSSSPAGPGDTSDPTSSGLGDVEQPDYRDFAYLAFTIGMCYQVSDTALRGRQLRRVVLVHAIVSYVFGVFIIAAAINLVAGLLG